MNATTITTYQRVHGQEALDHAAATGCAIHQWAHVNAEGMSEPDRAISLDAARALAAIDPDAVWCLRPAGTIVDDGQSPKTRLSLGDDARRFVVGYWRLERCVDAPVSASDLDPLGDSDSLEELDRAVDAANASREPAWLAVAPYLSEASALAAGRSLLAEVHSEWDGDLAADGLSVAVGSATERVRAVHVDALLAVSK